MITVRTTMVIEAQFHRKTFDQSHRNRAAYSTAIQITVCVAFFLRAVVAIILPAALVTFLGCLTLALIGIGQFSAGMALSCVLSVIAAVSIGYFFGDINLDEGTGPTSAAPAAPATAPVPLTDSHAANDPIETDVVASSDVMIMMPPGDSAAGSAPTQAPQINAVAPPLVPPATQQAAADQPPASPTQSRPLPPQPTPTPPPPPPIEPRTATPADLERGELSPQTPETRVRMFRFVLRRTIAAIFMGIVFTFNLVAICMFFGKGEFGEGIGVLGALVSEVVVVVAFFYQGGKNENLLLDAVQAERHASGLREAKLRREFVQQQELKDREISIMKKEIYMLHEDADDNARSREAEVRVSSEVIALEDAADVLRTDNARLQRELAAAGAIVKRQQAVLDAHAVDKYHAAVVEGTMTSHSASHARRDDRRTPSARRRPSVKQRDAMRSSARGSRVAPLLAPPATPAVVPVDLEGGYAARHERRRLSMKESARLSRKDIS